MSAEGAPITFSITPLEQTKDARCLPKANQNGPDARRTTTETAQGHTGERRTRRRTRARPDSDPTYGSTGRPTPRRKEAGATNPLHDYEFTH
eukprot:7378451-Prymnesium_polylepis.2